MRTVSSTESSSVFDEDCSHFYPQSDVPAWKSGACEFAWKFCQQQPRVTEGFSSSTTKALSLCALGSPLPLGEELTRMLVLSGSGGGVGVHAEVLSFL